MTGEQTGFICLLVLNTLAAVIYIFWNMIRKKKGYVLRAIIILLCPAVGICFFLLSQIWYRLFFRIPVDLEDVIFSKERIKAVMHAEEERERNMVPLEEAVDVTDEEGLRELMMNVARGDIRETLPAIALALGSEDTETAHYAASVLQDVLSDFRIHVGKLRNLVEEGGPDMPVYAGQLIDYMNQILRQRVFTDMEQRDYVNIMDDICETYYDEYPDRMVSGQYEAVSMRLLEVGDFDNCKKWCYRASYNYPNTLSTYTCLLKLYFASGQRRQFFDTIEELKQSSVVVDHETLERIRFFSKEQV